MGRKFCIGAVIAVLARHSRHRLPPERPRARSRASDSSPTGRRSPTFPYPPRSRSPAHPAPSRRRTRATTPSSEAPSTPGASGTEGELWRRSAGRLAPTRRSRSPSRPASPSPVSAMLVTPGWPWTPTAMPGRGAPSMTTTTAMCAGRSSSHRSECRGYRRSPPPPAVRGTRPGSRQTGPVWACGNNSVGQLGAWMFAHSRVAVEVTGLTDVVAISCGNRDICRHHGERRPLHLGPTRSTSVPAPTAMSTSRRQIPGTFVQVYSGGSLPDNGHTLALTTGDVVEAWGAGYSNAPEALSLPFTAQSVMAAGSIDGASRHRAGRPLAVECSVCPQQATIVATGRPAVSRNGRDRSMSS